MARLGKVRITPRGKYTKGTRYTPLDSVSFEGNSWIALQTSTDIEPAEGEYWTVLAQGFGLVNFEEAEEDEDIESGDLTPTIFGKLLKNIKTLRHNIGVLTAEKIDKTAITNQDDINNADMIPSSMVTYAHGQAISELNNNLGNVNSKLGFLPDGTLASGLDLNNFLTFNCLWGFGFINCFTNQGCVILVLPYGGADFCCQIGINIETQQTPKYRVMTNSVWSEWSDL